MERMLDNYLTKKKLSCNHFLPVQKFVCNFVSLFLCLFQMIVNVIEQVEANPAYSLLLHDGLVEDSAEDVGDDGGGVFHPLADAD